MRRVVAVVGIVVGGTWASAGSAAAADPSFVSRTPAVAGVPNDVAVADFNEDSRPDVVTGDSFSNTVSVHLRGDDALYTTRSIPRLRNPWTVAAADLDGDLHADVVAVNSTENRVELLLGAGDGTFSAGPTAPTGSRPIDVDVADFNGDGRPDLVTSNCSATASVLLAQAAGGYAAPVALSSTPCTDAPAVGVGDVDGDGDADVVASGGGQTNRSVAVSLGNGDGTFAAAVTAAVSGSAGPLAVGDLDADGDADVAVLSNASSSEGRVSVLERQSSGSFTVSTVESGVRFGRSVAIGELGGDGRADLAVVGSYFDSRVVVLNGNGDGLFTRGAATHVAGAGPLYAVVASDFDADGRRDLITANGAGTVGLLRNAGDGSFASSATGTGYGGRAIVAADLDRDGRQDLAVANAFEESVSVRLGRGDGRFAEAPTITVGRSPLDLVTGDFDRDGRPDLAVAEFGTSRVSVLTGRGDGTFALSDTPFVGQAAGIARGDFNGDGKDDLATASGSTSSVTVLLGRGDATFDLAGTTNVSAIPRSIAASDLNSDGRTDLVVAVSSANAVQVLLGRGDGAFDPQTARPVGATFPTSVAVADLDDDGVLDLATANDSGSASVLRGVGAGAFANASTLGSLPQSPAHVAAGDLDGDGDRDLVVSSVNAGTSSILLNDGSATFTRMPLDVASSRATAIADLDGDGRPDLANLRLQDTISVSLNRTVVPQRTLTVTRAGAGAGTVSSDPAGIACGATCAAAFPGGREVRLTAASSAGSVFTGFTGERCNGARTCTVTLGQDRAVTATFAEARTLTVTKTGSGSGIVRSSPAGIACRATCTADFAAGASVTLTATPDAGATFTGFSGAGCSGAGTTCTVTLEEARAVTAGFALKRTLLITKSGSGSGTVTSDPAGISCGSTCSARLPAGQTVTITATAAAGSGFLGFSGDGCSGSAATCIVTMDQSRAINARFGTTTRRGELSAASPASADDPPAVATRTPQMTRGATTAQTVTVNLHPGARPAVVTLRGTLRVGRRIMGKVRRRSLRVSRSGPARIALSPKLRRTIRRAHARKQKVELVLTATFDSGTVRRLIVSL